MPITVKERNAELFIILFSFTTVNGNLNPVIFNPLTIKVEPFLYTFLSSKNIFNNTATGYVFLLLIHLTHN